MADVATKIERKEVLENCWPKSSQARSRDPFDAAQLPRYRHCCCGGWPRTCSRFQFSNGRGTGDLELDGFVPTIGSSHSPPQCLPLPRAYIQLNFDFRRVVAIQLHNAHSSPPVFHQTGEMMKNHGPYHPYTSNYITLFALPKEGNRR